MAEAIRPLSVTPGLLTNHSLAINRHKHSPRETKELERIVDDQHMLLQRELKGRKFACAALNLCALISYRTGDKQKAITIWKNTLREDATNLNALQDLITTYDNSENTTQADQYRQLFTEARCESSAEQDRQVHYARCLAEQAYAEFCDLQTKSWDNSAARRKQIQQFQEALIRGKDVISQEERRDWLYYKGQAHEKFAKTQFRVENKTSHLDSVQDTYTCLWDCLQMSKEPMHQAQVWCALGNTFTQSQRRPDVLRKLVTAFPEQKQQLQCMVKNPQSCYEKALSLDEKNKVWILARLGICKSKNRDKYGALVAFNMSIMAAENLPDDDPMRKACRLAYDNRAMLYVKESKSKFKCNSQKRQYLDMAQVDTKKALQISFHPNPFATSAEVHYLLAKLEENDKKKTLLLEAALIHFNESLECQDGQSNPYTHITMAQCHCYMEQYTLATEQYQQSFNCLAKYKQHGTKAVELGTMVAQDLLCLMLKTCQIHENPAGYKSAVANRLKLVFHFLEKEKMQQAIHKITCEGYLSELLRVLLQAMEVDPNSNRELIASCLACVADMSPRENEVHVDLLNELSFLYQQWKAGPQFEEDNSSEGYTCPQAALHKAFEYDFNVIRDDTDQKVERWVKYKLLPKLRQYGFKGYDHSKDSKLGILETMAQANAMEKSCYILAVISPGFCGNLDCLIQAEMACKLSTQCQVVTLQFLQAQIPANLQQYQYFDFTGQDDIHQLALHMSTYREE